jgi:hypothetical protein
MIGHLDSIPIVLPLHEHGCIVTVSLDGYHKVSYETVFVLFAASWIPFHVVISGLEHRERVFGRVSTPQSHREDEEPLRTRGRLHDLEIRARANPSNPTSP